MKKLLNQALPGPFDLPMVVFALLMLAAAMLVLALTPADLDLPTQTSPQAGQAGRELTPCAQVVLDLAFKAEAHRPELRLDLDKLVREVCK